MEPCLLSIESWTGHLLVYRMSSKTSSALQSIIGRILAFNTGHSHTVKVIRTDNRLSSYLVKTFFSPAAYACRGTELVVMPNRLNEPSRQSSRAAARSNVHRGLQLPRPLYQYLIMDLYRSVNTACMPSTPNILIMGFRASISMQPFPWYPGS